MKKYQIGEQGMLYQIIYAERRRLWLVIGFLGLH